jgi:hypothetical protein
VAVETPPEGGTLVRCTVQNARPNQPAKKSGKKPVPKARAGAAPQAEMATK